MTEQTDRRQRILDASAELFARKGVSATTVREIADAVGVLSGSLYHHFESKDAILNEVLRGYLDTIQQRYADALATDGTAVELLHRLVLASLQTAAEQPDAAAIYQNELSYLRGEPRYESIQAHAADIQQTWLQVIKDGVADGSFRDDIEPRVFYRLLRDAVWLSVRYNKPNVSYSAEKMAADVTSIFLDGYAAHGPKAKARRVAATNGRAKRG